jgi:hypothetical protein
VDVVDVVDSVDVVEAAGVLDSVGVLGVVGTANGGGFLWNFGFWFSLEFFWDCQACRFARKGFRDLGFLSCYLLLSSPALSPRCHFLPLTAVPVGQ